MRAVGRELGLPEEIVARQPLPARPGHPDRRGKSPPTAGHAAPCQLDCARRADRGRSGQPDLAVFPPVVLLRRIVRSVGVQGDNRTYGHPIVLRPVSSEDAMTADSTGCPTRCWSAFRRPASPTKCLVNRVVLDITSKPPGTIEWESPNSFRSVGVQSYDSR